MSGAHFNPVVSLAFAFKRLVPVTWLVPYWVAQLAGSILACLLVRALFGDAVRAGVSTPHVPDGTAVAIEAVLTWLLVVVILGTADRHRIVGPNAALAVGATIALCGLIALPIEGASMNPARSAGPALVAATLGNLWIYILGPVIGASLAVFLMRFLHGRAPDVDGTAAGGGARRVVSRAPVDAGTPHGAPSRPTRPIGTPHGSVPAHRSCSAGPAHRRTRSVRFTDGL